MSDQRLEELWQENYSLRQRERLWEDERSALKKRIAELESVMGKRHARVDYAVIRFAKDYPKKWIPSQLDGRWFHIDEMPSFSFYSPETAVARAIDWYEARDDGRIAQVFEVSLRIDQVGREGVEPTKPNDDAFTER